MQVVEGPLITLAELATRVSAPRTPGVHVTDCIDALMRAAGVNYDDMDPADRGNWIGAGFMLEEALAGSILPPEAVVRPGEIVMDRIIGTPDWIEFDDEGVFVGESKCTWKSYRGFDLMTMKFMPWLYQLRAYCRMLNTYRARLIVLFINGDYSRYVPEIHQFVYTFTERELEENWTSLCRWRDRIEAHHVRSAIPD